MTVYAQICTKKSSNWSKYSKVCVVGIQIRKYVLRWTCVYQINFKIRNSKIQANYTAKVKVVRESPTNELKEEITSLRAEKESILQEMHTLIDDKLALELEIREYRRQLQYEDAGRYRKCVWLYFS